MLGLKLNHISKRGHWYVHPSEPRRLHFYPTLKRHFSKHDKAQNIINTWRLALNTIFLSAFVRVTLLVIENAQFCLQQLGFVTAFKHLLSIIVNLIWKYMHICDYVLTMLQELRTNINLRNICNIFIYCFLYIHCLFYDVYSCLFVGLPSSHKRLFVFCSLYRHIHNYTPPNIPDSKVHGANMGSTWVLSAPDGHHIDPMNLALWYIDFRMAAISLHFVIHFEWRHILNKMIMCGSV